MKTLARFGRNISTGIASQMAAVTCVLSLVGAGTLYAQAASPGGEKEMGGFPEGESSHVVDGWMDDLPADKYQELTRLIELGKQRMEQRRNGNQPAAAAGKDAGGAPRLKAIEEGQDSGSGGGSKTDIDEVFSDAWFRENYETLQALAQDEPNEGNVRRWLIAKRILEEKQRLFEASTRKVLQDDPSLRPASAALASDVVDDGEGAAAHTQVDGKPRPETSGDHAREGGERAAVPTSPSPETLPLARDNAVPEPLRGWEAWSVRGREGLRACTWRSDASQTDCAWPGRLKMSVDAKGADFSIDWETRAPTWVALPGDRHAWPMLVMDGMDQIAISEKDGRPWTWIADVGERLSHLSGRIIWNERPEAILLPAGVALFEITIDGSPIGTDRIDHLGKLWLRPTGALQASDEAKEGERIQVYRLVEDGQPVMLRTRIALDIGGKNRSLSLPGVLPEGFLPMRLDSEIPARVDLAGNLELQVRPGQWVVELTARSWTNVEVIGSGERQGPWPAQEVWAFKPALEIRTVSAQGATEIAPDQSGAPQEWSEFRTFLLKPGESLALTQLQRGRGDARADALSLDRRAWLDFAGTGLTVHDKIAGTVDRPGRLEAGDGLVPGQILVDERARYLTRLDEVGREGIEIDQGAVSVQANSRLEPYKKNGVIGYWPMRLPVSGWNKDFESLTTSLELPPGWTLIEVDGADRVRGAWLREWSLVDIFFVIVTVIVIARLYGVWLAVLGAATLVLTWHSAAGLQGMWLSFALLGTLRTTLIAGTDGEKPSLWRSWLINGTLVYGVLLIGSSLVLAGVAMQSAMFPQLSKGRNLQATDAYSTALSSGMGSADGALSQPENDQFQRMDDARPSREKFAAYPAFERIDPGTKIGTGPGTPQWSWTAATLGWLVPTQEQQVALYALTPTQTRFANIAQATLLLLFSALLFLKVWRGRLREVKPRKKGKGKTVVATCLALVALFAGMSIHGAQAAEAPAASGFPSESMLHELGDLLTHPPKCSPSCASAAQGWLRVDSEGQDQRLVLRLSVHAQEETTIPILKGFGGWRVATVAVNGNARPTLLDNEVVWVRVPKGVSTVDCSGALPRDGRVTLQLPMRPMLMDVGKSEGWRVEGIESSGRTNGGITLTKVAGSGGGAVMTPSDMPPLVRVERTVTLGVDWEVANRALRIVPADGPVVVRVPLMSGERVVSDAVVVEDGEAVVTFENGEMEKRWISRLDATDTLRLTASLYPTLVETWRLRTSELWHAEPIGLTETTLGEGNLREWRPWAGEMLEIDVTRPIGLDTRTATIESALLEVVQGRHASEYTLELDIRASQGGQHAITIPKQAELQEVTINGLRHQIGSEDGWLRVNLGPGRQTMHVRWKEQGEIPFRYATPSINLGDEAVNAEVELRVSGERWVLWTSGPTMGPAVRLWSRLVLALAVIGVLAWWAKDIPMRLLGLVVLAIGITQATGPFMTVAVAVLLFWSKRYWQDAKPGSYNLLQAILPLAALVCAAALLRGVTDGLIGMPQMHIAGNGSSGTTLRWYEDRTTSNAMPQGTVVSVTIAYYRLLMLGWALLVAVFATVFGRWFWRTWVHPTMFRSVALPQVMARKTRPAATQTASAGGGNESPTARG